ncbi:flavodoxin family protein [Sharpea azabuensis]|uniref:flavodoxin family protein n=1 Tax=Sharpea azabuensis TaxID=322505 RepID=UPI000A548A33|nr:flavodoxin family protein [Sharpea azabuensis]
MKEADGILLGSPVYCANVSANMQALLERAAAVAAVRRGGAMQAVDTMNHFFLNHEMIVVGSTYWNMGYGQMPGDVCNDEEGLANMRNLGQNMSYLLNALKSCE